MLLKSFLGPKNEKRTIFFSQTIKDILTISQTKDRLRGYVLKRFKWKACLIGDAVAAENVLTFNSITNFPLPPGGGGGGGGFRGTRKGDREEGKIKLPQFQWLSLRPPQHSLQCPGHLLRTYGLLSPATPEVLNMESARHRPERYGQGCRSYI